jgi:small conductance mechanosensitive channel
MVFPILAQASNVATQFPETTQPWPTVDAAVAQVAATSAMPAGTPIVEAIPAHAGAAAPTMDFAQQLVAQISAAVPQGWEAKAVEIAGTSVLVLMLMAMAWTVSSWASSLMRAALERVKFDETLSIFLCKLVRWSILGLAVMSCLEYFDIRTTSVAAVIGATSLAIGLAFQGTLSNFSAGAMLLIFRPYKVGDDVNVAGYTGTVREIELFTTAIDTGDNRRIIIPNGSIFGAVIENVTHHPTRRIEVLVGTAYEADIDETRKVLERAVRSTATIVPTPEPAIVLLDLGASSVNWAVRAWTTREKYGQAKQDVIRAVKNELDAARIAIPFPQLDLHLTQAAEAPAVRRAA